MVRPKSYSWSNLATIITGSRPTTLSNQKGSLAPFRSQKSKQEIENIKNIKQSKKNSKHLKIYTEQKAFEIGQKN